MSFLERLHFVVATRDAAKECELALQRDDLTVAQRDAANLVVTSYVYGKALDPAALAPLKTLDNFTQDRWGH